METKERVLLAEDVIVPAPIKMDVWVSEKQGYQKRYFLSEGSYRKEMATHQKCSNCQNVIKVRHYCEECSTKKSNANYLNKPFQEWDGITPVCIYNSDQYFWGSDEIDDYLSDNELEPSELKLIICTPNHLQSVDEDYWADYMPENYDDMSDFNKEFVLKLKEFNEYISTLKPLSWSEGIYRTEYRQD